MEVILLSDIANLGHEGDVVRVADGYARNYLIPKSMATTVTKGSLRELEQRRRAIGGREADKEAQAQTLAERLRDEMIVIRAAVGEGGRLHGEVTQRNIAAAVAEQLGIEIERRGVDIPVPIRETGDYLITATLYKEVKVEVPVRVISAEEELEAAEEELVEADEHTAEAEVAAEVTEEEPADVQDEE